MTFDDNGNVASCFSSPADETERTMSYHEYRERQGIPIGAEEEVARADLRRLREHATTDHRRLHEAERRLRSFEQAAGDIATERDRAAIGVPLTPDEIAARDEYRAIEDSVVPPWKPHQIKASNEAAQRRRDARARAFAAAGVQDPEFP